MKNGRLFFRLLGLAVVVLLGIAYYGVKKYNSPHISLCEISALDLRAMQDSLVLCVAYEDRNGDIGSESETTLFIEDTRNSMLLDYSVPRLLPDSLKGAVTGRFYVVIRFIPLLGDTGTERFSYRIRLVDRKGNSSNVLSTPLITLKP
ncbi:MAG: hypothetical protein KatS3mg031_2009 [Chitinophagales bacterium]|nr:MAG: hypothetical protein KatS3mg031_2009 [Chitinophagales bacterium]